jgi:hypothetical protein
VAEVIAGGRPVRPIERTTPSPHSDRPREIPPLSRRRGNSRPDRCDAVARRSAAISRHTDHAAGRPFSWRGQRRSRSRTAATPRDRTRWLQHLPQRWSVRESGRRPHGPETARRAYARLRARGRTPRRVAFPVASRDAAVPESPGESLNRHAHPMSARDATRRERGRGQATTRRSGRPRLVGSPAVRATSSAKSPRLGPSGTAGRQPLA